MKTLAISLSVVINLIVVGGVLWLTVGGGAAAYIGRAFVEPLYERKVSQFDLLQIKHGGVVFLGDSITEGGAWNELFPEASTRNRGIGWDSTAGVLRRLHQVTDARPSKVFLLIGTNDLLYGVEPDVIVKNTLAIVAQIRESSPETVVYVQSILPREASYRASIESVNRSIQSAIKSTAEWVDLYPAFIDEQDGSIADRFSNDELHLTGEGYALWSSLIGEYVQ
jgi:lysophospholipase L1-like esterase